MFIESNTFTDGISVKRNNYVYFYIFKGRHHHTSIIIIYIIDVPT